MFKKIITILTAVSLIFSYVVIPVNAISNEDITSVSIIAKDSFDVTDYDKSLVWENNRQIANSYLDEVPAGTGFSSNWLKVDETGALVPVTSEDVNVQIYCVDSSNSKMVLRNLPGTTANVIYRELLSDINFENVEGKYEFSVDVSTTVDDAYISEREPFAFIAGNSFEFGYNWNESKTSAIPYITVNGQTVSAETEVPMTFGFKTANLRNIKAEVILNENGDDEIKVSMDSAVVSITSDIKGTAKNIGFYSVSSYIDNVMVKGVNLSVANANDKLGLKLLAKETFEYSDYPTDFWTDTQVNSAYAEGVTATGTGFLTNWLTKNEEGAFVPVTASNVQIGRLKNSGNIRALRVLNPSTLLYRELENSINFDSVNGKYEISLQSKTTANDVSSVFEIVLGENLKFGYEQKADEVSKVAPYVVIDGNKLASDKYVSINSGIGNLEPNNFKVSIYLNKDGSDLVTFEITDYNGDTSYVAANGNLKGKVTHFGLEMKYAFVDDIFVKGGSLSAKEKYSALEVSRTHYEPFDNSEYVSDFWSDTQVNSSYAEGITSTGTGFSSNWLTKNDDGTYQAATASGIKISRFKNSGNAKAIRVDGARTTIYRQLEDVIKFNDIEGKYQILAISKGSIAPTANQYFEIKLGDDFAVGYVWNDTLDKVSPYVVIDDVKTVSDASVNMNAGIGNLDGNKLEANVYLTKDDMDAVEFIITDVNGNKASVLAVGDISGEAEYVGFDMSNTYFDEFEIKGTDLTEIYNQIEVLKKEIKKDYSSIELISSLEDGMIKDALVEEFDKLGIAYDDFDEYAAITGKDPTAYNGGAGWDGSWYGNEALIKPTVDTNVPGYDVRSVALNFSRKLKNSVDLSIDGEYYIKTGTYTDVTADEDVNNHNFTVSLGDIKFGTKGSEDPEVTESTGANCRIQPTLGLDGTAQVINPDVFYTGRKYNDYFVRIVSSATSEDIIEYYFVNDNHLDAEDLVKTETFVSDAVIDTVTLSCDSYVRVPYIMIDCWNKFTGNDLSVYEKLPDGADYNYYVDYEKALSEIENLPKLITTDYYKSKTPFVGFEKTKATLEYLNGEEYILVDDIKDIDASSRGVRVSVAYKNFGLYDDDEESAVTKSYGLTKIFAFYYEGKLLKTFIASNDIPTGGMSTTTRTYDFPVEDGWPKSDIDYSKLMIKCFALRYDNYAPADYAHTFNNSIYGH